MEGELNKAKEELRNSRVTNLLGRTMPSRNGTGPTPEGSLQRHLPPGGGTKKPYSEAVNTSTHKRFKILVKSKINLSTEAIKTVVRTNINPTAMKVGVKSFKSLKNGRVLLHT
jgi:hypothetical protein